MAQTRHYVAIDLGAESGRVMLGAVDDHRICIEEVYRFPNGPVTQDGTLRWDMDNLLRQIKIGLAKAVHAQPHVTSIGIDTWGVDFGLLDQQGRLIEHPYHYRDLRTEGMMEKAFGLMPRLEIYRNTGIQFMPFNSLFQLLALKLQCPEVLSQALWLLFMPDLIGYCLTGQISVEYTIASTSQMMDMNTGRWARPVLEALGLPESILPEVIQPGSLKGMLKDQIAAELGISPVAVVAVGSHDTASAVAAVPVSSSKAWAYLSSGTWSLMGIETSRPLITDQTCQLGFTNEGGVDGTIRVLTNIMGLWLVQECRRYWLEAGKELDYSQLVQMAGQARPFAAILDVDREEFLAPGRMPQKINAYLERTGQSPVEDPGQMVRVILEGLALRYAQVMLNLEQVSGRDIEVLHIVGGGIKNELLNQFTADATGKMVITGPAEATGVGNILMQAKASGQIRSLADGRAMVARSFQTRTYQPKDRQSWIDLANRASDVIGRG